MATVTGAGEALFVRACLSFLLRNHVDIYLRSDSVAGRGIARRQGLGRVRHLDVQYLWIQQKLAEKQFKLGPVSTFINPSDLGTKALQINRLQFLLGLLGVVDSHREHELVGKDEMSKEFHNQQFREKLKEALKVLRCNEHFGLSHHSKAHRSLACISRIRRARSPQRVARARPANRTLACISRTRRARSPQRVARAAGASQSRLHFARSTRTISAEGCARARHIALSPAFRAFDTHDLRKGLRAHPANCTLACTSRTRHARSPQRVVCAGCKSHSRLHFAHSTRTISAEGSIFG